MEWIYLVLIVVVLVFGLGVVVLNRRRSPDRLPSRPGPVELTDRTSELVRPPRPLRDDEGEAELLDEGQARVD